MMTVQYGFYHNNDVCVGCKTCIIACKDKYDLPVGEKFRRVYDYGGGSWEVSENGVVTAKDNFIYSVSVACMHCAAPACIAVCPVDAIKKREDGIVYIESATCIGCGSCVTACPYGEPYMSASLGIARKCDLCMDYIDKNENPACVDACPMRCLLYGEFDDLKATFGEIDQVDPIAENTGTAPSMIYTRSRLNPDGALKGVVLNDAEELESASI